MRKHVRSRYVTIDVDLAEREIEKRVHSLGAEAALDAAAWRTLGYVLGKFPELEGLIVNELLERSRMEQLL